MFKSREGQQVPQVTFPIRVNDEWQNVSTDDLFKGKTVLLFALPGAYTPTCSSTHLPRYNELAEVFKVNGIDSVICLAVNDPFVMEAWKQEQHAEGIGFLPDGNGEFSAGMGLLVNRSEIDLGQRSWRYSMRVKDGLIEKMFIEPEEPGDPFKVSDADAMLKHINPDARSPARVTLFSKPGCPHPCMRIVVEGGPRLNGDFCAEHLIDEQFLTLAPQIAGRDADDQRLSLVMGNAFAPGAAPWGSLTDLRHGGTHLFLRYSFHDSGAVA